MRNKTKIGWIMAIIVAIFMFFIIFSYIDLIHPSRWFVEGDGDELVEKIIDKFIGGTRMVCIKSKDQRELNYIIDRIYDAPELFWVDMEYNMFSVGNISFIVVHNKYEDVYKRQAEIDVVASAIIKNVITSDMSEYDKVLALHDWICENVTYGTCENNSDQDIYGALVLKRALCAGYAESFTYLLDRVGIKSSVISGDSIDQNGEAVPHAWNLVYIDNQPYYFDITWNDSGNYATYDWFGVTSKEFKLSHFPSKGYNWIDANASDANYYIHNNMYIDQYSAKSIAKQISKQGAHFVVKCSNTDVFNKIKEALDNPEEIRTIMKHLGIKQINAISYTEDPRLNCIHITIRSPELPTNPIKSADYSNERMVQNK